MTEPVVLIRMENAIYGTQPKRRQSETSKRLDDAKPEHRNFKMSTE